VGGGGGFKLQRRRRRRRRRALTVLHFGVSIKKSLINYASNDIM
jgi:hypothetical protein